jgi:D-alanyl-D-alanine dipeptidase
MTDAAAYWAEQMEAGIAYVERVLAHPVEDDGEPMVDIVEGAREAGVEIRCSRIPHAAGRPRIFLVRAGLLAPLLAAAAELQASGHTLVVEDAFRTRAMQRDLALCDEFLEPLAASLLRVEPRADPATILRRLSVVVAGRPKGAGHMAGAAVDVSVLGPDGEPLDRGGPYPTVSEKMPMGSPFVSEAAARNRRFVSELMGRHGFVAFPFEFWHFSRDDAFARVACEDARPARYGPVDLLAAGRVAPTRHQLGRLYTREDLARRLDRMRYAVTSP